MQCEKRCEDAFWRKARTRFQASNTYTTTILRGYPAFRPVAPLKTIMKKTVVKKTIVVKTRTSKRIAGHQLADNSPSKRKVSLRHLSLVASCRRCYPKTNIQIKDNRVRGATSVMDGFRWPARFVQRLMKTFSSFVVLEGFRGWLWDVTTCFSGIGCPEIVPSLNLQNCLMTVVL